MKGLKKEVLPKSSKASNEWGLIMRRHARSLVSIFIVLFFALFLTLSVSPIPLGNENGGTALADSNSGWEEQDLPYTEGEITAISAVDGNIAWAAIDEEPLEPIQFSTVLKTENGGLEWFIQNLGTPRWVPSAYDIYAVDEYTVWALKWGTVYKTNDGGLSWDEVFWLHYSTSGGVIATNICALDADTAFHTLYAYNAMSGWPWTCSWAAFRTSDGGANWDFCIPYFEYDAPPTFYEAASSMDVSEDGTVLVTFFSWTESSGLTQFVLRSIDAGLTWETYELGDYRIIDICAVDSTTAWAVGDGASSSYPGSGGGAILKTTDGGASWEEQYRGWQSLSSISAVDSTTAWAAGELNTSQVSADEGVILKTIDGGETWSTQYEFEGGCLSDICAVDANTAWAGGKSASGSPLLLKTEDGGESEPEIASISPDSAPPGCEVTIAGFDFENSQGPSHVSFGDAQAAEYISWSDEEIKVIVPAGIEGEVAVTVTTPEGTSNPMPFTVMPGPLVASIIPDQAMQHTVFLDITGLAGDNFIPGATVRLEKGPTVLNAYNVNVVSETEIACSIGLLGAEPGTYDVVVTNPDGGVGRLAEGFTVDPICGTGSGTALIMLGLSLGLLSLAGSAGLKRRRKR